MQLIVHQLKEKITRICMKVKRCPIGQEVRDQDPLNLIWNGEDPFHGIDLIIQAPKGVHDATSFKINSTKNGMIIGFKWYAPYSPIYSWKRNLQIKMDSIHFRIKMGGSFSSSEHVKDGSETRVQKGKRGN